MTSSNKSVYVHILVHIDKCITKRLKYNGNITVLWRHNYIIHQFNWSINCHKELSYLHRVNDDFKLGIHREYILSRQNILKTWQIFKGGGGGTDERRWRELSRGVWGHAPHKFLKKFESLKWPLPAFCDNFRTRLILIFASKLRFCKKKIQKWGWAQVPLDPPLLFDDAIVTKVQQSTTKR